MKRISIMIAEDHKFWRDSSAALLMDFPERYEVIGKAEDGKILLELVAKRKPDFILLDIQYIHRHLKQMIAMHSLINLFKAHRIR